MDYEATQSLPAIRSSILNGDLPWPHEEVFDQWVQTFAEMVRAEASIIALTRGHNADHGEEQDIIIRQAFKQLSEDEDDDY